jgi:urea transport system substrate-binding protein
MVHAYADVYFWKAAVDKARSFDVDKDRKAAVGLELAGSPVGPVKFAPNQRLYQAAYLGQFDPGSIQGHLAIETRSSGNR